MNRKNNINILITLIIFFFLSLFTVYGLGRVLEFLTALLKTDHIFILIPILILIIVLATLNIFIIIYIFALLGGRAIYLMIALSLLYDIVAILIFPPAIIVLIIHIIVLLLIMSSGALDRVKVFLEGSIKVILDEKELILPIFLSVFLVIFFSFSAIGLFDNVNVLERKVITYNNTKVIHYEIKNEQLFAFLLFGYILVKLVVIYFIRGVNIGIVYLWYRGKDPRLIDGLRIAASRFDKIAVFSLYSTLIYLLNFLGRKSFIGRVASYLINMMWGVANYFTLPTIIVLNKSIGKAIRISTRLLIKHIPDVLAKEIFVDAGLNTTLAFLVLILLIPYFGISLAVMFLVFKLSSSLVLGFLSFMLTFIMLCVSIIVALITITSTYHTILFLWCLDQETKKEKPRRIPREMVPVIEKIKSFERLERNTTMLKHIPKKSKQKKRADEKIIEVHNFPISGVATDSGLLYCCSSVANTLDILKKDGEKYRSIEHRCYGKNPLYVDDRRIYLMSSRGVIEILDKKKIIITMKIRDKDMEYPIVCDDKYLYCGFQNNWIGIFNRNNGSFVDKAYQHEMRIVSISIDERNIYSTDGLRLYVWNKINKRLMKKITYPNITSLVVDRSNLYLSLQNGKISVLSKTDLSVIREIETGLNGFSPITVDDRYIYLGSFDGKIRIYKKETVKLGKTL